MNQPTSELQRLLQQLDQQIAQASDEPTRQELQRLRARLESPEMLNMARELAGSRPSDPASLVLEFHDPWLPDVGHRHRLCHCRRHLPVRHRRRLQACQRFAGRQ